MDEENLERREGAVDQDEFLVEAKEFFELNRRAVTRNLRGEGKVVSVDFDEFAAHSPELAEALVERPEETVQLLEVALEGLGWGPSSLKVPSGL